jgi:hypothetical protein
MVAPLITRDTVIGDTPAVNATSFTVGLAGVPFIVLMPGKYRKGW